MTDIKITITDEQAENTRMAYSIMSGIPAELINLRDVRQGGASDEELLQCNSCACVAGWLSAHEYFKDKGLKSFMGGPGKWSVNLSMDFKLFGDSSIFDGPRDYNVPENQKQEALERLREHLFAAGRITKQRNIQLQRMEALL